MRLLCWVAALLAIAACGGEDGGTVDPGGTGGAGGTAFVPPPPMGQATFQVSCELSTLELSFSVEFDVQLTEAFADTTTTQITLNSTVTLSEATAAAIIENDLTTIDVTSLSVRAALEEASPSSILTTLTEVPIDEFDITVDEDNNGEPGPHRFELETVVTSGIANNGARNVLFSLGQVSFVLGDFQIPERCLGFSISGVPLRFPVNPI